MRPFSVFFIGCISVFALQKPSVLQAGDRSLESLETTLESRFQELQMQFNELSPLDIEIDSAIEKLLELQRDYETDKLLLSVEEIYQSAREYDGKFKKLNLTQRQLENLEEARKEILETLNKIADLNIAPDGASKYSKGWHQTIVLRNSQYRKFIRQVVRYFQMCDWGEDGAKKSFRVRASRQLHYVRWFWHLLPHLGEISQFFFQFFKDVPNSHQPHFTPQMHQLLNSYSAARKMRFEAQGFDEQAQERFQEKGLHLWVMNHRDIYLDPVFVSQILKAASCSWNCHYAVDPFRYLGGASNRLSQRMTKLPDFLPVGTEPGRAIARTKEIIKRRDKANVFIFPEATTSLIGDTAFFDPYFILSFVRSLRRANIPGGIHFHLVSTDIAVDVRVNFRQRISQLFQSSWPAIRLSYHGSFSESDLPKRLTENHAFKIHSQMWLKLHTAQANNSSQIFGQLRQKALSGSLIRLFEFEGVCRRALNELK